MILSEKLKQARERKGYSQAHVAEQLNISRQAISKWENGWTSPDLDNLVILSNLYELSLDDLLKEGTEDQAEEAFQLETNEDKNPDLTDYIENKSPSTEVLLLVMLAILSCLLAPAGLIVPGWILVVMKKHKIKSILARVICVMCIIVSLFNSAVIANNIFFHIGQGEYELVDE